MGDHSSIAWTNATLPVVTGCEPAGEDCFNCYMARLCGTRLSHLPACRGLTRRTDSGRFVWTGEVRVQEDLLTLPHHWRRSRRIFISDRGDLFHPKVPRWFLEKTYWAMAATGRHRYQILTKRTAEAADFLLSAPTGVKCLPPLDNVWIGLSAGNQALFDGRWPALRRIAEAGWRIMLSFEPLIGPITLPPESLALGARAWMIVGGESGVDARTCDVAWIRALVRQCLDAGVPVFVKQLGRTCRMSLDDIVPACTFGAGWRADAPGADHGVVEFVQRAGAALDEWPSDLLIRQYPEGM